MRILLLNQTFYPENLATSQQVTDLALHLVEQGYDVTVVTGRRGYEAQNRIFAKHENYRGIEIHRVGSLGLGKTKFYRRFLDAVSFDLCLFFRLLSLPAHNFVVSFTSPPLVGLFGTLFTLLKGGKNIQWLMDVNPDAAIAVGYLKPEKIHTRLLVGLFELTLRLSDHVIVLDRWMKKRILEHGAEENKIEIVPPWPVVKNTEPIDTQSVGVKEFREEHGLTGKFVILYSGNHSIVHPLDTLLEAALKMRDQKDVVFLFTGAGFRVADVTVFKKQHQLENIVQLPLQPRERLRDSLGSADVHIVVMGEKMSGLVHTSKIYGVLATGQPYIVIGPEQSHLGDLQHLCPYGFRVNHGSSEALVTIFKQVRSLGAEEKRKILEFNTEYVNARYDAKYSLQCFDEMILGSVRETAAT